MAPKTRWFVLMLGIALPLDQLSKWWIINNFHYAERLPLISGILDLTHVRNPGGAFSFFADGPFEQRMAFFIGSTALAVVLLLVFFRRLEPEVRLAAAALGTILGGALGNLTDRVLHGEVIDFIDVHLWSGYTWPTFNFADSFIVVGVAVLLIEIFLEPQEEMASETGTAPDPPV